MGLFMPKNNEKKTKVKNILPLACVALVTCVLINYLDLLLDVYSSDETQVGEKANVAVTVLSTDQQKELANSKYTSGRKVADIWQKEALGQTQEINDGQIKLFDRSLDSVIDPDYLYAVLQDVELDQNGDVVLNHKALQALELTVNRSRLKLNAVELAELQELIQIGLPGKAGVQTARIVGDYYNYLGAKEEMGELQLSLVKPSFETWRDEYQQLVELREMYMGADVSLSLFNQLDANAEYMFEVMALDRVETYSEEEKKVLHEKASDALIARLVDIEDWQERYQSYKQERQAVELTLGQEIGNKDKDRLLAKHFSILEIEKFIENNIDRML
jgi:hypothetical protein